MSRVLAELLGAEEPAFRLGLRRLEETTGLPAYDIRLTVEIEHEVREKMRALGLDPTVTTADELYHALGERLRKDETTVRTALQLSPESSVNDLLQAVRSFLGKETADKEVFAIKPTVMRALLKKLKPKATMKALGYRSMDSMFKHESVLELLVATQLVEDEAWQGARLEAYKKLQSKDFELRKVAFEVPLTKKWPQIAEKYTAEHHHNLITAAEVGGVMLLPLQRDFPALALLTLVLGFRAFEQVRARSALLKLHQVEPSFSEVLYNAAHHEPMTEFVMNGHQLSWESVHWFYGSDVAPYHPEIFEPHILPEDMTRHDYHASLAKLSEALSFWRGSHFLALFDQGDVVSLNILDVALGVCNGLAYGERMLHYMRESLGRELFARYLSHDAYHNALQDSLSRQLAPEFVFDE
jgi:hypothetical protein